MKKRKINKLVLALAAMVSSLAVSVPVYAVEEPREKGYTYNYDYWGDVQYGPDAYSTVGVYNANSIGVEGDFKNPDGLFVKGDRLFICDTGNDRIIETKRVDVDQFELVRVIDKITGNVEVKNLSGPTDIFVGDDGYLYICDKGNHRILKLTESLRYVMEFTKPTDATFDQSLDFLPDKAVADDAGRIYCTADNVNKGMIKYEADGSFVGFHGASKVVFSWTDYLWKKFSTKAQRAAMESFTPTEYDNVYMDSEGFIFACTSNVAQDDIKGKKAEPVRRLNLLGNNILIENGYEVVIGDFFWGDAGGYKGTSLIVDVTALDRGVYFILDKVRGRIFGYDKQGNLLYAFGGSGHQEGYFRLPSSIEHIGNDLLVLDAQASTFTVFTPTVYGNLIYQAIDEYDSGDYDTSGATWEKVMELNGNYELAYNGIGMALMRQGKYKEALPYFKAKWYTRNYSKAFKQYRKQWVEEHIGLIFLVIIVLFIVPMLVGKIKKIKWQIDTADIFKT